MGVHVNRCFAEVAFETNERLKTELADTIQAAFPEFNRAQAEEARDAACFWMGRTIPDPH
jgi:hypothetical protein